jgi:methylglutaconyl-CoA hydratase
VKTLRLSTDGNIAILTLTRPEKRNAISVEMMGEMVLALREVEEGDAHAVVLTGEGKAFCAGMDLETLQASAHQSVAQNIEESRRMARVFLALYRCSKPTVAAVNGAAIAGGCGLATLCDFTLALPSAKFGYTEVSIGFLPALVSVFLTRQIGEKRARDLLLSGRIVEADEAARLGLVNAVVPAGELFPRAVALAKALARNSPSGLRFTKKLLDSFGDLEGDIEKAVQENAAIRSTADFKEGISAFLEKRTPQWE